MGFLDANDRPGTHARSWYAETAGPFPDLPPLDGDAEADVCIVGGGYAGLSAALHLAEAGLAVRLIEAHRVGWGASGRNGGQLGVGPRADIRDYERIAGRDDAAKVWEIAIAANGLVKSLVARHAMPVDLTPGTLEAAAKPGHVGEMAGWVAHVQARYGHGSARMLDRAETEARLGTHIYHGAILDMAGGHLHPLRYALGLARAAAAAGARLHERTRACRLASGTVVTDRGTIRAAHVLLACNGYLDGLDPRVARKAMPINNFIIATEPMDEARARSVIRDGVCVSDTKFVLDYYRLTPDRRMLWGGGESYRTRFPADIAGLVRCKMLKVFPSLADLRVTHAWGGTLAITANRFPAFQRLAGGVLAISGWSGSGIHMATMGGKIAADAIRGEGAAFETLARLPVPDFPGGAWLRAPLLWAALTWYALRDRL